MIHGVWSLQWANLNSQRKYPLADDATAHDVTGTFKIPDEFLLFIDLPINSELNISPEKFFISKLGVYSNGYSIVISYDDGVEVVDVATSLIAKSSHSPGNVYNLAGLNLFSDTSGRIVIGRTEDIDAQPPGMWDFDLTGARLDPDAVRPMLQGVSGITVVNANGSKSQVYNGVVELLAGNNIQITPIIEPNQPVKIRISATANADFAETSGCARNAAIASPIRTINGRFADPDGNFNLLAGVCTEIQPIKNGIKITNNCSKPCCDCNDLKTVTDSLIALQQQANVVNAFANNLQSSISSFLVTALGARISDQGCIT